MNLDRPYTDGEAVAAPKPGDTFTISGVYPMIDNPDRRWWQFWKPRWIIDRSRLQTFKVVK